ncbi:MAG: DUF1445 domain-containing protein [Azospirillaceae bacterium]
MTDATSVMPESRRVREAIRAGEITGTSRGLALGHVQANLVIIRERHALDFVRYCQRNQRACPVLEITDTGDPEPRMSAPGADLRTDVARYAIYRDGIRQGDRTEIGALWRDDLVAFLIGSGISFDGALRAAGVQTERYRWVLRTDRPTVPAGPFHGPLSVTMRWLTAQETVTATQVTSRFPFNHGGPIHVGDPAGIGADLADPLFGGPVPDCPAGLIPVFWACGVTPQEAAIAGGLDLMIAHAPAHAFITDLEAADLQIA